MSAVLLMYHAIERGPKPLCIQPELFRYHAAAIAASGATALTVSELGAALRARSLPERAWRSLSTTAARASSRTLCPCSPSTG